MKNKLTRKLLLSVLTLAFAVVSLGASTFAWFTLSNVAKVSAFTAQVKVAEGIEIAVSDKNYLSGTQLDNLKWYSGELPLADIQGASRQLKPLTDDADFFFSPLHGVMPTGTGTAISMVDRMNNSIATIAETDSEGNITAHAGYVQFYVYLRALADGEIVVSGQANETGKDVEFTGPSSVPTFTVDAAFTSKDGKAFAVGNSMQDNIINSARLSLVVVSGGTGAATNKNGYYEAVESASTAGTILGNSNGSGTPATTSHDNYVGAHQYYYVKTSQFPYHTVGDPASGIARTYETESEFKQGITEYVASSHANVMVVEVTVWIEGDDFECMNAQFAQNLTVAFKFNYTASSTGA